MTVMGAHVSTQGEMGHVVITVPGMAQIERHFIKERQRESTERAKAEGSNKGGQPRIDRAEATAYSTTGWLSLPVQRHFAVRLCKCIA